MLSKCQQRALLVLLTHTCNRTPGPCVRDGAESATGKQLAVEDLTLEEVEMLLSQDLQKQLGDGGKICSVASVLATADLNMRTLSCALKCISKKVVAHISQYLSSNQLLGGQHKHDTVFTQI